MDELAEQTVRVRQEKAKTFLAGMTETGLALCIDKVDLHYAFDTQGRTYVDMTSGGGALPMGTHHLVTSALQAPVFPYVGRYGDFCLAAQVQYAQALSDRFPMVWDTPQQVYFTASGNEAMQVAQRMAQWAGIAWANIKPLGEHYEPLDTGMAQRSAARAAEGDRPIVVDERLTAFGRLGSFRAAERYGLDDYADRTITVLGESGGGGIPFGAVVAPAKFFPPGAEWLRPRHGGSPMACAAGFQILAMQDDFFYSHVLESAEHLDGLLSGLQSQFPNTFLRHQGRGMAQAMMIHPRVDMGVFTEALLNNGIIAETRDEWVLLTPPLTMTGPALGMAVNSLSAALVDIEKVFPVQR
jgi:4-aminobutyrate aminotransferase-like enzyme